MAAERRIKITVLKVFKPEDVFPDKPFPKMQLKPCERHSEGQVFYFTQSGSLPEGFCSSAWNSIFPFVITMIYGGDFESFYKEPDVGVFACPDGLRPVLFKIELD